MGLSYGKYVALYHPPGSENKVKNPNNAFCEHCGMPYFKNKPNRRFCCDNCRVNAFEKRRREARKKEGELNA